MQENQHLRNLIRSLGNYIGDGLGGILPSLGFDRPNEFVDFINRAETDTAFEGFQRRKKATQTGQSSFLGLNKKRSSLDDDDHTKSKRTKSVDDRELLSNGKDHYTPLLVPLSPATPATGGSAGSYYQPGKFSQTSTHNSLFSELLQGQSNNSAMYMAASTPESLSQFPSPVPGYPGPFHPSNSVPPALQSYLPTTPAATTATSMAASPSGPTPSSTTSDLADDDGQIDDPKLHEATKLIKYIFLCVILDWYLTSLLLKLSSGKLQAE